MLNKLINSTPFKLLTLNLIALSIAIFTIATLPELSEELKRKIMITEIALTILFTVEYAIRIIAAEKKREYIFSFYGIVDLLAILPFYLSFFMLFYVDLIVIRILRFLKIFTMFKDTKYARAMNYFATALRQSKEEIIIFLFFTLILLYLSAAGIYIFEHKAQPDVFSSIPHSFWWAITTLTTVGYGDVYPVTNAGKMFTFIVLICGLGVVAGPAGIISASLSRVINQQKK